jgi:hypothetical protein
MNQKYVLVLFLALCGVLALAAGCTSPTQPTVTPTATPPPSAVVSLDDLLLSLTDLPEGYSIVYQAEMSPGDPNCTREVCFIAGYLLSARNGDTNTSSGIDQAIARYNVSASPGTLSLVLADQLPSVASGNLTPLPDPGLGDASAAYRFTLQTEGGPMEAYLVIFGKGDIYEIILVAGPDTSESLAMEMAGKAAAKLP